MLQEEKSIHVKKYEGVLCTGTNLLMHEDILRALKDESFCVVLYNMATDERFSRNKTQLEIIILAGG